MDVGVLIDQGLEREMVRCRGQVQDNMREGQASLDAARDSAKKDPGQTQEIDRLAGQKIGEEQDEDAGRLRGHDRQAARE